MVERGCSVLRSVKASAPNKYYFCVLLLQPRQHWQASGQGQRREMNLTSPLAVVAVKLLHPHAPAAHCS
eukprot:m.205154 g.205154  ORF g.205154 m.205154 type:complete len:69 (+) comp18481_c1_seq3:2834-3040(+)